MCNFSYSPTIDSIISISLSSPSSIPFQSKFFNSILCLISFGRFILSSMYSISFFIFSISHWLFGLFSFFNLSLINFMPCSIGTAISNARNSLMRFCTSCSSLSWSISFAIISLTRFKSPFSVSTGRLLGICASLFIFLIIDILSSCCIIPSNSIFNLLLFCFNSFCRSFLFDASLNSCALSFNANKHFNRPLICVNSHINFCALLCNAVSKKLFNLFSLSLFFPIHSVIILISILHDLCATVRFGRGLPSSVDLLLPCVRRFFAIFLLTRGLPRSVELFILLLLCDFCLTLFAFLTLSDVNEVSPIALPVPRELSTDGCEIEIPSLPLNPGGVHDILLCSCVSNGESSPEELFDPVGVLKSVSLAIGDIGSLFALLSGKGEAGSVGVYSSEYEDTGAGCVQLLPPPTDSADPAELLPSTLGSRNPARKKVNGSPVGPVVLPLPPQFTNVNKMMHFKFFISLIYILYTKIDQCFF